MTVLLVLLACVDADWSGDPKQGDWDGDGWTGEEGDCANDDAGKHPGAEDRVGDGIDQDCDLLDGVDADGDRHASTASGGDDCDDTRPDTHAGAREVWYDGVDQACDGGSDFDQDGDGHDAAAWGGDDCDDQDGRYPGEELWDGEDDDCDRCVDEPGWTVTFERDGEGDWLVIGLTGGDRRGYALGLWVEGEGWDGEACRDGVTGCHPLGPDGGRLRVVTDPAEVRLGATTLVSGPAGLGWALWDSAGTCNAGGEGVAAYEAVGCCDAGAVSR